MNSWFPTNAVLTSNSPVIVHSNWWYVIQKKMIHTRYSIGIPEEHKGHQSFLGIFLRGVKFGKSEAIKSDGFVFGVRVEVLFCESMG